jgi:anti-sigma regulatory factor (Ser/Thr protein kinase)
MALVTMVDADRQWFKARMGMSAQQTSRDVAFCARAIMQTDLFIVADALQHEEFRDSPLVLDDPHIRFYAGAPLVTRDGCALGTLCVMDSQPRSLSPGQQQALRALSRQVLAQMELRRNLEELKSALAERSRLEAEREALIAELQHALADVRRLSGLLPVSSACKLNITIPADVNAIQPVVDGVLELSRQMKSAAGREFDVETSVREALANAIVHGCGSDPSKQIQCTVACEPSGDLVLVIRDPGAGFDPTQVPDPTRGAGLTADHGRGLYLINTFADEVKITSGRGEGTEIHIRTAPKAE